jgi:hypothetical protein
VALRPASRLVMSYDDCAIWALEADWLSAGGEGQFRVHGAAGTPFTIERADSGGKTRDAVPISGITRYYPAAYHRCDRVAIATASDRAFIAIGAGERWTISVRADGRILRGAQELADLKDNESAPR